MSEVYAKLFRRSLDAEARIAELEVENALLKEKMKAIADEADFHRDDLHRDLRDAIDAAMASEIEETK